MSAMMALLAHHKGGHPFVGGSRLQHLNDRGVCVAFDAQHTVQLGAARMIYVLV
jgi:hypothetical protein